MPVLFNFFAVLIAIALDYKFCELSRFHPLVGFGNIAIKLERAVNKNSFAGYLLKLLGVFCWLLVVIVPVYFSYLLEQYLAARLQGFNYFSLCYAATVLYVAIGWRSLIDHAQHITQPLKAGNVAAARAALARIVSRDTQALNETQISSAATESVLENGADAIFSVIFWFLVFGVPGVVLYRLANTLDAMWGYKNARYLHFGWCAARIDDLLNLIPARLCALSYALLGNSTSAWQCWRVQGVNWKSPNAGPVMAAGAGAINVRLGGGSMYHGAFQERPILGPINGQLASCGSIDAACLLVDRVLLLWLLGLLLIAWVF